MMYQDKMGLFKKGKKKLKNKVKEIKGRFNIDYANQQIDTLNRTQGTNVPFLSRETMQLNKARDILNQSQTAIKRDARLRRRQNRQRFFRGN